MGMVVAHPAVFGEMEFRNLMFTTEQVDSAERQIVEQSKRIDFYLTEFSVELLVSKMRKEEFEIPAYQREDTWEPQRKSRFIESLLMGLPIPFLFFWESPTTGKLEIVDGAQRLRTIDQFLHNELELSVMNELTMLEGFRFGDLTEARQRKVKNRSIRGIVLNEHADEQARFDIFDRINTSSKVANDAEVRRGAQTGPFLDLVILLATGADFMAQAPVSDILLNLREREELVSRFFAYGDGLNGYKDRVEPFVTAYAERMNKVFTEKPDEVEVYRKRFLETMAFVGTAFPNGFRRTPKGTATPRARFEAIAIGSYLALQADPSLAGRVVDVAPWITSDEFKEITGGDGANAIKKLKGRFTYVKEKLLEGWK